ncbi:MAG: replication-associated recombination protein A [Candidatus Gastranaerophilales bacterium]|nr:replication-associated recombination protein A [Candidatus Gastranaerophilales bacterium]
MNLFDSLENNNKQVPLAELMRPKNLEDYLGQTGVINPNSPFYKLLMAKRLFSFILWGPPGCGKTTLARLVANFHNAAFVELSAVNSGVKEIKETAEFAKQKLREGIKTIVFIDEIHRFSKTQQDALLPHIESGLFYFMGSTTENPSFHTVPALISRAQVIILNAIDKESLKKIALRGLEYLSKTYGDKTIEFDALELIAELARGDARYCLNAIENTYFASDDEIKKETVEELLQKTGVRYSIDSHYDYASAFQKSLRGSDANAAIYYLAKMLTAGEDPRFIARRLIVVASEDVGNADFRALLIAEAALRAVEHLGMPEARITLAQAVEFVARAKKSNRAIMAIDNAISDIKSGLDYLPPKHLRDAHYKDASKYGFGVDYVYTHSNPDYVQQFMPDEIKDKKYFDI